MSQAQQLGANAVVNVRFTTSAIAGGSAELYAYGTAVAVQPSSPEVAAADIDPTHPFAPQQG